MSSIDEKLTELRAGDGFYRDGIAVVALMIEDIRASNLADDLTLAVPGGAAGVELNGGAPIYLVQADNGDCVQATFSGIVAYLEGDRSEVAGPAQAG